MYKNARKSKIQNIGKDVEGSARHTRGGKRNKEEVLNDPTQFAKKSFLLKNFPPEYVKKDLASVKLHLILRKYPSKLSKSYINDKEDASLEYIQFYLDIRKTILDWEPKIRDNDSKKNIIELIKLLKKKTNLKIKELRKINYKSTFANTLIDFYNNSLSLYKKRSALKEINLVNNANLTNDVIANVIDKNKGISASLGKSKTKKQYFSRKEAYGKSIKRKGYPIDKDYIDFLINDTQIEAIQWGNYVSDKERSFHLKLISESLLDLSEALNIPLKSITRNKLSIAVGARGRGTALAHFEKTTNCINLTKKNGFGSLAHEIGHFFDAEFTLKFKQSSKYITSTSSIYYSGTDHEEILTKWDSLKKKISNRIRTENLLIFVSPNKKKYWLSGHEIFARCFERYVKLKLNQKNIINDYLVNEIDHPLWCSNEELCDFVEIADYIINELKK